MTEIIKTDDIQGKIYTIRGVQVMFDNDLANLYNVENKRLNEQVKRNINRFPERFMFQLTKNELDNILRSQTVTSENDDAILRSQFATSKEQRGGRRYLPYVFTEQGISMLSAVLKSETAVNVSIQIIDAFVEMRKFILNNANIFNRLDTIEKRQIGYQIETDQKFNQIFKALEDKSAQPTQGIFYNGQIYDAYTFVSDLIRTAKSTLTLIDNYIDDTVLTLFTKRNENVDFHILTKTISKQLKLDIDKHNQQYKYVRVQKFDKSHDRFLIIDDKTVYHFGASLKDLGKKWFAFSKMNIETIDFIKNLKK